MKNKLGDLNNALFAQLERLGAEELAGDALAAEIQRANAIVQVGDSIITNARLQLEAVKLVAEHGDRVAKHLPMLGSGEVRT